MSRQNTYLYEFGLFRLIPTERQLLRRNRPVPLPPKAFDILLVLVENSGHLVEKDMLLNRVWPDTVVEESNLAVNVATLRKALGDHPDGRHYIKTEHKLGYRFVEKVRRVSADSEEKAESSQAGRKPSIDVTVPATGQPVEALSNSSASGVAPDVSTLTLEPVGGAVPLDSKFYIERPADAEFRFAILRRDMIVLVKGPRQVGKTSLLARGLQQAREAGAKIVLTDFQLLNASQVETVETLFLTLAGMIAEKLRLDYRPAQSWKAHLGPNINFTDFMEQAVLGRIESPLVWGLDEVDRLFTRPFGNEVFGLFRAWHNARALEPDSHWRNLTLAMAYATEAHLFITDLNQSPFNVGTRLTLEDFTRGNVAELNCRYGSPLADEGELEKFYGLVGGHPYLVRRGLHEMTAHGVSLNELEASVGSDAGPFGDHLRRILILLRQDADLSDALHGLLHERQSLSYETFYRLRSAGLLAGDAPSDARFRCGLYETYLKKHLT